MEKDNEIKGEGNSYDFGSRSIYDGRVGRFISLDPDSRKYPDFSPYAFAANNPILLIDEDGRGPIIPKWLWEGKGYNIAFMAGVIDGLWDTGVGATDLVEKNLSFHPFRFVYDFDGAVDNYKNTYKQGKAVISVLSDGEARNKMYSEVKELLGDWVGDISFAKGVEVAGYQHGKLVFEVILALVGVEEANLLVKTGKFSINASKKLLAVNKLERTMVQKSGVWGRLVDLPLQKHHLLTKYGAWGKTFNKVLKRYGLDVKKSFNIVKVHHKGMHPDSYHQEMYKRLLKIDEKANGDKEVFLKEFEKEITKYVQENQEILHKTTKIIGE